MNSLIISNCEQLTLTLQKKWGRKEQSFGQSLSDIMTHNHTFMFENISFEFISDSTGATLTDFSTNSVDSSLQEFNYNDDSCGLLKFKLKYNNTSDDTNIGYDFS